VEKKTVERGRPKMIIWHMRIAFWVSNVYKYTRSLCNMLCFSTLTMVAPTLLNVT